MKQLYHNAIIYAQFAIAALVAFVATAVGATQYDVFQNRQMRRQGGAVVFVKSTVITNADATPAVINKGNLAGARVRQHRGIVTSVNGDSIASIYRVCRVKSNDLVDRLEILNASWGAACTGDFGLYQTAQNGGAVVDVDFFATAVDLNTARLAPLDITLEAGAGVTVVANCEKRIWEALGLTVDPQVEYDVAVTLVAAAAAAGALCVKINVVGAD